MNVQLTGHQIDITPALRDYVNLKLERIKRHFDHMMDVNVVMSASKLVKKVEANVHVRGRDIFVESTDADMYAAIDELADKLDRQIIRHKEKVTDHRPGGHTRASVADSTAAEEE